MKKYLLTVDNGGTYIKGALFDREGRQIAHAKERSQPITPKSGWLEYNQNTLWEINCRIIRSLLATSGIDPAEIACVGFSAQGCGLYMVDKDGKEIRNGIASSDIRALDIAERWDADGTSDRLYPYIYRRNSPGHTNTLLRWMKEHEPENYARIGYIFSMKDILIHRITGKPAASMGCLSVSGLMNLQTGKIDPMLAEAFGIPEMADKFAPLYWDNEICGTVSARAAAECGLAEGTSVIAGHHDVLASAMSLGVLDSDPLFIITGTCAINAYASPTPILNGTVRYNELYAFPGLYLIEEGFFASSGSLEWVIPALYGEAAHGSAEIYAEINRMISETPPAPGQPFFLPYLRGWRDNADASGCWIGLHGEHTRANMLRAVYEGVAFSHMLQIEHLLANREKPALIRMAGGACNSPEWVQIFADALNTSIEITPDSEMGTLGTAITAAAAAGFYPSLEEAYAHMRGRTQIIRPIPENVSIYAEKFARYKALVEKLDGVWGVLKV